MSARERNEIEDDFSDFDDDVNGGEGDDTLESSSGDDMMSGGYGNDLFHYQSTGNGRDTILDFTYGDEIRIAGVDFANSSIVTNTSLMRNQIYVETTDTTTTLHIGTDDQVGEDTVIHLARSIESDFLTFSGDTISLNTQVAAKHLENYGVNMQQANQYILEHIESAEILYATSQKFGLTTEMLAQIVGSNISQDDVIGYFNSHGFNATNLDL